MNHLLSLLLPPEADNTVHGAMFPAYLFILIAILSTVRSLIHVFSRDGGAGSIAGMNLEVEGANEIVFSFALWGTAQLVYAIVQLVVAFRYRSLVPFMYLLLMVEALLRMLAGRIKPVAFSHTPPGAIANRVIIPLSILMLALSLWTA